MTSKKLVTPASASGNASTCQQRIDWHLTAIRHKSNPPHAHKKTFRQGDEKLIDWPRNPWPNATRAVPSCFLRCALYGTTGKALEAYLIRSKIQSQAGYEIYSIGTRLNQLDLDLWVTVVHFARRQMLGSDCIVSVCKFLKALGKTDTGPNRKALGNRLRRLKETAIEVTIGEIGFAGNLIDDLVAIHKKRYMFRLNPKLGALYSADQFTLIDWRVRQMMSGKPLAQWLHGYYASHKKPFALKVSTLLRLSGSANANPRSALQKLKKALDVLVEVSTKNGYFFEYEILGDLVYVQKSAFQKRTKTK